MTSKQTLLEALKEAEGPSRELDAMVSEAFGWSVIMMPLSGPHLTDGNPVPRYTTFPDACLALLERVLPDDLTIDDLTIRETRHRGEFDCEIDAYEGQEIAAAYDAPTRPLALLIAIVEAIIAQEQETEHD